MPMALAARWTMATWFVRVFIITAKDCFCIAYRKVLNRLRRLQRSVENNKRKISSALGVVIPYLFIF